MKELLASPGLFALCVSFIAFLLLLPVLSGSTSAGQSENPELTKLPEPRYDGKMSVERAISLRRSAREYKREPLTLSEVSQVLWAAQGITHPNGFRAAPSAGALYPLEIYLAVGNVEGLSAGVYKYRPQGHGLLKTVSGDRRAELSSAALGQSWLKNAPAVLIISAEYGRTTRKYRERGINYVHYEAGHAAQNISLQAVSLDLGTVDIGAFYDSEVKKTLNMADGEEPLLIMPLGRRR